MHTVNFAPMVKKAPIPTEPFTMRFESPLMRRLEAYIDTLRRTSRTDIIHAAVEEYLDRREGKQEKPAKKTQ